MKRPAAVRALIAINVLMVVFLAGLAGYFLVRTHAPGIHRFPDVAEAIRRSYKVAAILGFTSIFWIVALWAILKRWNWGWWYGVLLNLVIFGVFAYSIFEDWPYIDGAEISVAATLIVTAGLYLTSPVRHHLLRSPLAKSAGEGI